MKKKNRICVAPMLNWTDRHCRYFHRLLIKKAHLYTEMMTADCLLKNKKKIQKNNQKNIVSYQIATNDPIKTYKCAKIIYQKNFFEININVGCPSIKLKKNFMGISLIKKPLIISECINAAKDASPLPVSIKTRIGLNNYDSYQFFRDFIYKIYETSKCKIFIIHARKAILKKLNPKENLKIPKLNYKYVYKLKKELPQLNIIINGEINSIKKIKKNLNKVDGVMIGRSAYKNPFFLDKINQKIFKKKKKNKKKILKKMYKYAKYEQKKNNIHSKHIFKHMFGFFKGKKGSRKWKQILSKFSNKSSNQLIKIIKKKYIK